MGCIHKEVGTGNSEHLPGQSFLQACVGATSEDSYTSIVRVLRSRLNSLPKVNPVPEEANASRDLIKLLTSATREQKKRGEAYLGVDVVLNLLIQHVRT